MPELHDPDPDSGNSPLDKIARRLGLNVNIRVEKIEGGGAVIKGIEIGHISIPITINLPRYSCLIVTLLLVFVAIFFFMVLYPQFAGPGPMNHDFNIAVADFGEIDQTGRLVQSADATQLSDSIFNRLSAEFASIPEIAARVEVRHEKIGFVPDENAARQLTDEKRLNANLVIYGHLEMQNGKKLFTPEFYVRELKGAEELVGPNQFGGPLLFEGSMVTADEVKARCEALSRFAIGLAYLVADKPDAAIARFKTALAVDNLGNAAGKEVIYLYLGTAYKSRATVNHEATDLIEAYNAYSQALSINPQYSRAYIGLGNVAYEEYRQQYFRDPSKSDASKLDQAQAAYSQALAASDKPAMADVEAKIHYSLGNIYIAQAQIGQPALFEQARAEFKWVTAEYERDLANTRLRPIAASAYCGLGVVDEHGTSNYPQALDSYQKCLENSEENSELRDLAIARLEALRQLQ